MDITIKIVIKESEYKEWTEFQTDGVDGVKFELLKDFKYFLRALYIKNANLEININE